MVTIGEASNIRKEREMTMVETAVKTITKKDLVKLTQEKLLADMRSVRTVLEELSDTVSRSASSCQIRDARNYFLSLKDHLKKYGVYDQRNDKKYEKALKGEYIRDYGW